MRHVVIAGTESPLGASLARLFLASGARVSGVALDGDIDALDLRAIDPIDILVLADGFTAEPHRAAELARQDFAAGMQRLAFAPLRLANRLRPRLQRGTKAVLLTRPMAGMTVTDPAGAYLERPARAAAHALWKCLSVDLRAEGIQCLVITHDGGETDDRLLATIETAETPEKGCVLLAADGTSLPW